MTSLESPCAYSAGFRHIESYCARDNRTATEVARCPDIGGPATSNPRLSSPYDHAGTNSKLLLVLKLNYLFILFLILYTNIASDAGMWSRKNNM